MKRIFLSGILAGILSLLLHLLIGESVGARVSEIMIARGMGVQTPPYSASVNILAFGTTIFPGIASAFVFYLIEPNLPGKGIVSKGVIFGLLCMAMRGSLIRLPLMDLAIGNPIEVVLLQRLEPFAIGFCMALVISAIIKKGKRIDPCSSTTDRQT